MEKVFLPDYNGGSIVNLMSSIRKSLGGNIVYPSLKILLPEKIKPYRNIILLVIDGMGYEYLKNKRDSYLNEHLEGNMTSVFLATTASAITTFLTGVAPQQHAFTGWHMLLKEIGVVAKILPYAPRYGGINFNEDELNIKDVLDQKSFFIGLKSKNFSINHIDIAHSYFNEEISKNSKNLSYISMNGMFKNIKKAVNSGKEKKFIYSYWPEYDSLSHMYGVGHEFSDKNFDQMDKSIKKLAKELKNTNTLLIVTADHGFINITQNHIIKIDDHPKLKECLSLPLCGEGRVAYCYVHPDKTRQFEEYIRKKLSKYCYLFKSRDLIKKNYFGLYEPNKKLFDRVGDYTLIMKGNYIIKDLITEYEKNKYPKVGHHGGVSKNEMLVPLVLIEC